MSKYDIDEQKRVQRLGEERINSQGLVVKIKEYRSSNDIDLEFSNGDERKGTTYRNFKEGSCLSEKETLRLLKEKYEGQERINYQGYKMVCTKYKSKNDIEVTFKTGEVYTGINWVVFDKGNISREKGYQSGVTSKEASINKAKQRADTLIGEVFMSREGDVVKVISGERKTKLHVFCERTGLYKWTKYSVLKEGLFSSTKLSVGTEFMSVDNYKMRVICNGDLLKVMCVDTGVEIDRVPRGVIRNKEFSYKNPKVIPKNKPYEGREIEFRNGVKGVTRNYDGKGSCDLELKGTNKRVILKDLGLDKISSKRFPRKYEETLIDLVEKGILNPEGIKLPQRKIKEGEIYRNRSGQMFRVDRIISLKSNEGVIVEFEDGTKVGTNPARVRSNGVVNPNFKVYVNCHGNALSVSSKGLTSVGYVTAVKFAYVLLDGEVYYMCKCNKCKSTDIFTTKEMLLHNCNKGVVSIPKWVFENHNVRLSR